MMSDAYGCQVTRFVLPAPKTIAVSDRRGALAAASSEPAKLRHASMPHEAIGGTFV